MYKLFLQVRTKTNLRTEVLGHVQTNLGRNYSNFVLYPHLHHYGHTNELVHKHTNLHVLTYTNSHVRTHRDLHLKQNLANLCNLVPLLIYVYMYLVEKIELDTQRLYRNM